MTWNFSLQAIDQIINSAAKTLYMSAGQVPVPITFRGPNGKKIKIEMVTSGVINSPLAVSALKNGVQEQAMCLRSLSTCPKCG